MVEAQLRVLDRAYEEYWHADEAVWLHQYEPELDNVRAALHWARNHDAGLAVALYGSAWPLFVETDLHAEGRNAHAEAVSLLSPAIPKERVARFWEAVASYDSGRQVDRARFAAELAAASHAETGDRRSQYYALAQFVLNTRDEGEGARQACEIAHGLAQPDWPARLLALGATVEGAMLTSAGRFEQARAAYRRALDHALAASERQALAATVHIVELDIASGAIAAALQLARPLAVSLRYSGRQETRQELLVLLFGALVLAGELDEARAAGVELCELARRLEFSGLYPALDAMALFAVRSGRPELAVRITACAQAAHESHGKPGRSPAAERVRSAVQ
jgi:hypothetical protein